MKRNILLMLAPSLILTLGLPAPALAWGDYAHRLTGRIAMAGLTPKARTAVRAILARGASVDTPGCPLGNLEEAAVWADCVRGLGDRFDFASTWHYQNISVCRPFDIAAKCPDGNCVTAQIPRQLAILADTRGGPAKRAQALAFFVHFMGDMHQPLHLGEKDDRGGNDVRARYGAKEPPRMNLHRIWDTELAERALTEPPAISPVTITPAQRAAWTQGTVTDWARESWEISRTRVYTGIANLPDQCPGQTGVRADIDQSYVAAATPAVRQRAAQAGVRIAAMLNRTLGR
ncbi:S1/P1 nuclease [Sandarakinorhabdus sp.]|uniref:S1/P1 nuclease n=1 Tax=Sandarakinorhabdus sp. TaxID=1916663 RepID=UPI00286E459C|nr:S1/P1 nuclease [Sandarakinorhabdus sp.]